MFVSVASDELSCGQDRREAGRQPTSAAAAALVCTIISLFNLKGILRAGARAASGAVLFGFGVLFLLLGCDDACADTAAAQTLLLCTAAQAGCL